jgi:outer membrane protein
MITMKPKLLALTTLALSCQFGTPLLAAEPDFGSSVIERASGRTLEDFFNAAINYNPNLNIARERWRIGTARKDQTNGQLLPQVNVMATVSDNQRTATGTTGPDQQDYIGERYSLQVSQVLFNWQAFEARRQAYLLEDQSEAEYYAQLAQLLTDVADRYLAVLAAEDTLRSLTSEQQAMENQINQIQMRYDLQLARITDLYDAQARNAAISAELVNAESQLALAQESLRALSGLETGQLSRLPENIVVPPLEGSISEWLERARTNNQLIEARTYALQAAQRQVSRQRGAHMPRVSMVYMLQQSNIGFENIPLSRAETNYVGIDVQMPLFSGGSARAGVREAQAQRNIAENELLQVQLDIVEQTRTAYLQVKSGEARIAAARVLAESTDTAYTAMQRGFELGTVTTVEVLNALRDRFRAERELQITRYDHITANLILRREAGTLGSADILDVSRMLNFNTP